MAEYVYPQDQTVQVGQNVLFMDSIPYTPEDDGTLYAIWEDVVEEVEEPAGT